MSHSFSIPTKLSKFIQSINITKILAGVFLCAAMSLLVGQITHADSTGAIEVHVKSGVDCSTDVTFSPYSVQVFASSSTYLNNQSFAFLPSVATFSNLLADTYSLFIPNPYNGYAPASTSSVSVIDGQTTVVNICMTDAQYGAIQGTLTDSNGTPINNGSVVATRYLSNMPNTYNLMGVNSYNFSNLDANNHYTVTANVSNWDGHYVTSQIVYNDVVLSPNSTTTLDFVFNIVSTTPSIPTNFHVATTSLARQLSLSWDLINNQGVTGYRIYSSEDVYANARYSVPYTDANYVISGLEFSSLYTYKIAAFNYAGEGQKSDAVSITTDPAGPNVPTSLTVDSASGSQVNLSWNPVAGATSYNVYRFESYMLSGGTNVTSTIINSSVPITGLISGQNYVFRVAAVFSGNEGDLSEAVMTTTPLVALTAPTGLSATPVSRNEIDLMWNSVDGAESYYIYKNGQFQYPTTYNYIQMTGLDSNTLYDFSVKAYGTYVGEGPTSTISTSTLAPAPNVPTNFSAGAASETEAYLQWNPVSGAAYYRLYKDCYAMDFVNFCQNNYTTEFGTNRTLSVTMGMHSFFVTSVIDGQESDKSDSASVFVGAVNNTVNGYVLYYSNGTPIAIPGATVSLSGFAISPATTDITGYYSFSNIPNGSYVLSASANNYQSNSTNLFFLNGTGHTENITLTSSGGGNNGGNQSSGIFVNPTINGVDNVISVTNTSWTVTGTLQADLHRGDVFQFVFPTSSWGLSNVTLASSSGISLYSNIGADDTNLFINSSFELPINTQDSFGGWTGASVGVDGFGTGSSTVYNTSSPFLGNSALEMSTASDNSVAIAAQNSSSLVPGQTYTFSYYAKKTSSLGSVSAILNINGVQGCGASYMYVYDFNNQTWGCVLQNDVLASGGSNYVLSSGELTDSYQRFHGSFIASSTSAALIFAVLANNSSVALDAAKLEQGSSPTDFLTNILDNSSFGSSLNGWSVQSGGSATTTLINGNDYSGDRNNTSLEMTSDNTATGTSQLLGLGLSDSGYYLVTSSPNVLSFYAKSAGNNDVVRVSLVSGMSDNGGNIYNFNSSNWSVLEPNAPLDLSSSSPYAKDFSLSDVYSRKFLNFISPTDTTSTMVVFTVGGTDSQYQNNTVFLDAVQLEQGSVTSTYAEYGISGATLISSPVPNHANKLYGYVSGDVSSSTPFSFTFSGVNNPAPSGSNTDYDSKEFGVAAGAYVVHPYEDLAGGWFATTTISLQPQGGKNVCITDPSKPNDGPMCFWDTPVQAMPFMQSGFTMTVASGTYGGFTVNVSNIIIKGTGPNCNYDVSDMCVTDVVIDAKGGDGIVLNGVSNVSIVNLTVKNANGQKTAHVFHVPYFSFGGQDYNKIVANSDALADGDYVISSNNKDEVVAIVTSTDISGVTNNWNLALVDLSNYVGASGFRSTVWLDSAVFPDRESATNFFRTLVSSSTLELDAWATNTIIYNLDGSFSYSPSSLENTGITVGSNSPTTNIDNVQYTERTLNFSKHPYTLNSINYDNGGLTTPDDALYLVADPNSNSGSGNIYDNNGRNLADITQQNWNPRNWNLALISTGTEHYTVYLNQYSGINSESDAVAYFNSKRFGNDAYTLDYWAPDVFVWDDVNREYTYNAPSGPSPLETFVSGPPNISATNTMHAGVKFNNTDNSFFMYATSTNNNYGVWFTGTSTKDIVLGLGWISSSAQYDIYSDANSSDPDAVFGPTANNIVSSTVVGTNNLMFAQMLQIHVVDINNIPVGSVNVDVSSAGGDFSHATGTTSNLGIIDNITVPVIVKTSTTTLDWSLVTFAAEAISTYSAASTTVSITEFNQNITLQMPGTPPYGFPPQALSVLQINTSSVLLALTPDNNPSTTTYAIYDSIHSMCVIGQSNNFTLGSCHGQVVSQTILDWHNVSISGLTPDTNYEFGPVMMFGEGVFGTSTLVHTHAITNNSAPSPVTVGAVTTSTIEVTLNSDANPIDTMYAIYDAKRGLCVYGDHRFGSCDATPAVHTIADWGTETIIGLDSNAEFQLSAVVAVDSQIFGPTTSVFTSSSIPSSLAVSSLSALGATLTWDSNNNSTSTNYEIYGAGFTTTTVSTTTVEVAGLSPSTEYTFYVRAQNASDLSTYSNSVSITTATLSAMPNDPSGLFVNQITTSSAVINWTSGHGGEDIFFLEVSRDGVDFKDSVTTSASVSSFVISKNSPNTQTFVRLSAAVGGYATSSVVTTSFYSSSTDPIDPIVTSVSTSTAVLSWGENENPVTTTYQVDGNNNFQKFDVLNSTSTILSNLIPNANYIFGVWSKNHDGSLNSEVTAAATTTQAAVPGSPTAMANGQTSLVVSWDRNLNATGTIYQLYNYTNSTIVATTTANAYTVTGLSANTSYRFNVRAQNKSDNLTYTEYSSISAAVSTAAVGSSVTITLNTSASSTFQLTGGDLHTVTLGSISNGTATLNFASTPFSVSLQAGQSSNNTANGIRVTMNSVGSGSAQFTISSYTPAVVTPSSGGGGGNPPSQPTLPSVVAPVYVSDNYSVTGSTHVVIGNVSHEVKVNKIDLASNQAIFTIESTPITFTLKVNEEKVLDTNQDNVNDIRVKLNSISAQNKTVNLGIVSIADLQFTINHFDITTNDRNVVLYFNSPDAKQVAVSEVSDFKGASFVSYQKSIKWKLSTGDGLKVLYVKFRSATGGVRVVKSSIALVTNIGESETVPVSTGSFVFKKNLSYGVISSDVKQLQMVLKELGYYTFDQFTTKFGVSTRDAVKAFQKAKGIKPVNGMAGPLTREVLNNLTNAPVEVTVETTVAPISPEFTKFVFKNKLSFGNIGNDVKQLQMVLKNLRFFNYPQFTTKFGTSTRDAVKAFQKANGITPVNGIVGPMTIKALNNL